MARGAGSVGFVADIDRVAGKGWSVEGFSCAISRASGDFGGIGFAEGSCKAGMGSLAAMGAVESFGGAIAITLGTFFGAALTTASF